MAKRKKVKRKKLDPAKKEKDNELKKKIGERFKKFRKSIDKAQHHLAEELGVFQSTITNFELGKTFPNIGYLYRFYEKYGLNIHWLFTGQGYKFIHDIPERPDLSYIMESAPIFGGTRYNDYMDLLKHMQLPEIEKIIFAKLTELKEIYKKKIAKFDFEEFELEKKEKPGEE